jgi:hypothetical protein
MAAHSKETDAVEGSTQRWGSLAADAMVHAESLTSGDASAQMQFGPSRTTREPIT